MFYVSWMFFFFKQKTAYEMLRSLVGSEMCIRDRSKSAELEKLRREVAQYLGSEHEGAIKVVRLSAPAPADQAAPLPTAKESHADSRHQPGRHPNQESWFSHDSAEAWERDQGCESKERGDEPSQDEPSNSSCGAEPSNSSWFRTGGPNPKYAGEPQEARTGWFGQQAADRIEMIKQQRAQAQADRKQFLSKCDEAFLLSLIHI
eukprot:TRINITY_DN16711_c0_g1_i1.p1 TRINITY_DN16711_c0_g1~~TRINITY_DN16711_c0_g1_i1.p1  ORF type:complete len:204 (+),score=44.70 TRINITY_DN16711_c0_g1_i1:106-717(+)